MRKFLLVTVAVLHLLFLDALTKALSIAHLKNHEPHQVVRGLFDLAHVENHGCAWGLLQGHVWPLALFGLVAVVAIAWRRDVIFPRGTDGRRMPYCGLAECLLYAGIIGNLLDRIFRGYVVDFLDFHWGAHHFPCFNLADTFICTAVGLVLLQSYRSDRAAAAVKGAS